MYKELDIENWARRATYDFFRDFADPFFNFTAMVDVSRLYKFCKEQNIAVSLAALHYCLSAVNKIREFRIRKMGGKLVEFDRIHATQTILNDDETFCCAYFEMWDDVFDFDRNGKAARQRYLELKSFDVETGRLDLIYCSVIPWVSFTSFKHASRLDRKMANSTLRPQNI